MLQGTTVLVLSLLVPQAWSATLVQVNPGQCGGECSDLLNGAVKKCAAASAPCTVELAPGDYRVECPEASRRSTTQTEAPAVRLLRVKILLRPVSASCPHARPPLNTFPQTPSRARFQLQDLMGLPLAACLDFRGRSY